MSNHSVPLNPPGINVESQGPPNQQSSDAPSKFADPIPLSQVLATFSRVLTTSSSSSLTVSPAKASENPDGAHLPISLDNAPSNTSSQSHIEWKSLDAAFQAILAGISALTQRLREDLTQRNLSAAQTPTLHRMDATLECIGSRLLALRTWSHDLDPVQHSAMKRLDDLMRTNPENRIIELNKTVLDTLVEMSGLLTSCISRSENTSIVSPRQMQGKDKPSAPRGVFISGYLQDLVWAANDVRELQGKLDGVKRELQRVLGVDGGGGEGEATVSETEVKTERMSGQSARKESNVGVKGGKQESWLMRTVRGLKRKI